MKLPKTSKNDDLPQDFFWRAKRAGKTLVLGFQEKNTGSVCMTQSWPGSPPAAPRTAAAGGVAPGVPGCVDAAH